jgi:hypothetical protein
MDAKQRRALFLEMAARPEGTTAQEVYDAAVAHGDGARAEAYHNIGRRLVTRGFLRSSKEGPRTVFRTGGAPDEHWLDEDRLADILDPERPLEALAVFRETRRQLVNIPEDVWIEIRETLKRADARKMFVAAIEGYADYLQCAFREYLYAIESNDSDHALTRSRLEADLAKLKGLSKSGLGLSNDAVNLPPSVEAGLSRFRRNMDEQFCSHDKLRDEIRRRVAPGPFIQESPPSSRGRDLLVAGIDGSTRGGLLSVDGEDGDFAVGLAPMVAINTSAAQINRELEVGGRRYPAFLRLPERPEDIQRRENRYSIMARMFYPDLTESQYAHSVWNAMNVLELRSARRVMSRWETAEFEVEVPPADIVMLDGTIVPNNRDSNDYAAQNNYGKIVRELIECTADLVRLSEQQRQVVAGVVKNTQLHVLSPVINFYLTQLVGRAQGSSLRTWPLQAMNAVPDQHLVTRILTAGRTQGEPWVRTVYVLRPFYAATDLVERVTRARRPGDELDERSRAARVAIERGEGSPQDGFWAYQYNRDRDAYARLLDRAWIATFFVGAVSRSDSRQMLPRMEFFVPHTTVEEGELPTLTDEFGRLFLQALHQDGFEVAQEHAMFDTEGRLDILPKMMILVHETVKGWSQHLLALSQEFIGRNIASYLKTKERSARLRPWNKSEIDAWVGHMRSGGRNARIGNSGRAMLAPPTDRGNSGEAA